MEYKINPIVKDNYDVIVIGGGIAGISAAGRIISAPQGDGWEVSRVIPTCALTGEAAGAAAAYCIKNEINVCQYNCE